jgi:RHS repeat-associated protein
VAKDEFAYDPDGARYARKSTWQAGGNTVTEQVRYVGAVEIVVDDSAAVAQTITKTRLSPNVMHVKIVGTATEAFFEYAHRDHLGSIEAVTDGNGTVLDHLAFEAFGSRKAKDWSAHIPAAELDALLALDSGHSRKIRGFTGHEHLDRSGFIHMNGRVYDPLLGRFLSPDPLVQFPTFSQSWNRYSYVNNTPTSFTDPTGYFGNDTMEEIEVREPMPRSSFNFSAFQTFGSLGVSNGGGVGSGGGLAAGGFGEGATAASETEMAEADDSYIDEIVVIESAISFHGLGSGNIYIVLAQSSDGGAGRGDPHGDAGRAQKKAESELQRLRDRLDELKRNQGSRREKQEIRNKIDRLQRDIQRKRKGETHWRRGPGRGTIRGLWWLMPLQIIIDGIEEYNEQQYQEDVFSDFERCIEELRCA